MIAIELEYAGKDLVISREMAEKELGLHPGDRVEIRPKTTPAAVGRSPVETAKIAKCLGELREAFTPTDLDNWETEKERLWTSWRNRT